MAGARWDTQIREQKRNSRNRPTSIYTISRWYGAGVGGGISTWLWRVATPGVSHPGWDRSRVLGPVPLLPLVWSQKQGTLPLVNSVLQLGQRRKGPGWGEVVGAIEAASELGKVLPVWQGGDISSLPTFKSGWFSSIRGHSLGPSLFSHLFGRDKLLNLDFRMNLLPSPGALVQRTEKKLRGWCSPKLEKNIHYRIYIYCVLFDFVFFPFFFLKPQTFQNHTAAVRRVSDRSITIA